MSRSSILCFTCLSKASVDYLQLVQSAAAGLLTRFSRARHITPVLASLHWPPVNCRIQFKVLVITFRALHGQPPVYLPDLLRGHTPSWSLMSADHADKGLVVVPHTKLKTKGDTAFESAVPRLRTVLQEDLRAVASANVFKKQPKALLFRQAFAEFI